MMNLDSAEIAMNEALKKGASFADVRLERTVSNGFLMKNSIPQISSSENTTGLGIRVFVKKTLGFAATNDLTNEGVIKAVNYAIKDAKNAAIVNNNVSLSASKPNIENYEVKQKINLEETSPKEKIKLLSEIDKSLLDTKIKIPGRFLSFSDSIEQTYYANSEGSKIQSKIPRVNFYYFITIAHGKKTAQRYWQHGKTGGFEAILEFNLSKTMPEDIIALEKNLKHAIKPPKGKIDVVVGPQITGIIVHESGGHPYEADRILGREAAQAGESFLNQNSIGTQLGSKAVNIIDDPTLPGSFGFYLYDDEGIKAGKKQLMKEGKITSFLHSRESAASMGTNPNGSSRASGYDREPIPRMSNTFIEEGSHTENELIEEIKTGVLIKNFTEWNIDDKRLNQKYVGAEAYMIKNGRTTTPVITPTIEISTPALFSSIDATANNTEYHAGSCGKGEPMQAMPVWFGGPSLRIRNIKLK